MVGSNLLSALKKKARRYSFGERSPRRLYKGKEFASPESSPPLKEEDEEGASPETNELASDTAASPKLLTPPPRINSIQAKTADAGLLDQPVPQLERRKPPQPQSESGGTPRSADGHGHNGAFGPALGSESGAAAGGVGSGAIALETPTSRAGDGQDDAEAGPVVVVVDSLDESYVSALASPQALTLGPHAIGWTESTTKLAIDAEAALELELRSLTSRYEVLKKKTEEKAHLFEASGGKGPKSSKKNGRTKKEAIEEKKRLKEYERRTLDHARERLKRRRDAGGAASGALESSPGKNTAEKSRLRWQRARESALSMTPLQDQRGTKTNQMLRRLSMILREGAQGAGQHRLNSPSPVGEGGLDRIRRSQRRGENGPSPAPSGASEVSLSLEDLLGPTPRLENGAGTAHSPRLAASSSRSQPRPAAAVSASRSNFALELASAAKAKSVEVSLASMMAEAEQLAREVKLVSQDEQWTPNVGSLSLAATPQSRAAEGNKPIGRNLMSEFGTRSGQKQGGRGVSSASKTEDGGGGKYQRRPGHHRNKSLPNMTFGSDPWTPDTDAGEGRSALSEGESVDPAPSRAGDSGAAGQSSAARSSPPSSSAEGATPIHPKEAPTPNEAPSPKAIAPTVSPGGRGQDAGSPVVGLVTEPSEESVGSAAKPEAAGATADVAAGIPASPKASAPASKGRKKRRGWLSCLPCVSSSPA